jgi:predicted oxidoreductase
MTSAHIPAPCTRQSLVPDGPTFSRIALGFWRMADWGWRLTERIRWVDHALAHGVTTLDHADIYGGYTTEGLFGEMLRAAPHWQHRFETVTKCDIRVPGLLGSSGTKHYDTSRATIVAACERSLRNLGVAHIDLLLVHRPDALMEADEVALAFDDLKRAGKARAFGVSNFTPAQFALLNSRTPLVTNQVEASLLHRTPLFDGTFDQAQQLRCAPMLWSALAGGRLFGDSTEAQRLSPALQQLADKHSTTPTTIALAWLLRLPANPVLIHGGRRPDGLEQAVAATHLSLSREDWTSLLQAAQGHEVP